ncbi:hypothetical protein MLD38_035290 [Melastoma candidum]|uniref:Uncharacterized protein n=1 Tax=Melastoma candidum TaxID=119954 RepID=A0ACB9MCM6_9MYRT|nr:hypothetical protein MLD38_035290 [Melastoma candidum]
MSSRGVKSVAAVLSLDALEDWVAVLRALWCRKLSWVAGIGKDWFSAVGVIRKNRGRSLNVQEDAIVGIGTSAWEDSSLKMSDHGLSRGVRDGWTSFSKRWLRDWKITNFKGSKVVKGHNRPSKKMGPETYWPSHSQSLVSLVVGLGIFESDHVLTS